MQVFQDALIQNRAWGELERQHQPPSTASSVGTANTQQQHDPSRNPGLLWEGPFTPDSSSAYIIDVGPDRATKPVTWWQLKKYQVLDRLRHHFRDDEYILYSRKPRRRDQEPPFLQRPGQIEHAWRRKLLYPIRYVQKTWRVWCDFRRYWAAWEAVGRFFTGGLRSEKDGGAACLLSRTRS